MIKKVQFNNNNNNNSDNTWDHRVYEKEGEKVEKYPGLKREIGIPVVATIRSE